MPTAEELIKTLNGSSVDTYSSEPEELVIDAESRSINVPQSERLFGVKGDMNIERKYFRCPKIVGDNIDLSTHQIFIAYVYTERETGSILPSVGVAPYHCEDVEVDGEDITFSWKLTGNVFKNPGFILFKMYAKKTETDPNTVFNTTPAIGTVFLIDLLNRFPYRGLWLAGVLGAVNGRLPRLDCFTLCLERSTKFILCFPNLFADTIHHENIAISPIPIFQFVDTRAILLCHLQIPLVDFFVAKSQIPACEKCPLVDKEISCIFLFFACFPAPNGEAVWLLPGRVL